MTGLLVAYLLGGALFLGGAVAVEVAEDGTPGVEAAVTIVAAALAGAFVGVPCVIAAAIAVFVSRRRLRSPGGA